VCFVFSIGTNVGCWEHQTCLNYVFGFVIESGIIYFTSIKVVVRVRF